MQTHKVSQQHQVYSKYIIYQSFHHSKINNWNITINYYIYNVFTFNFKTNIMKKTKAFTMIEVIIVSLLLWIWLLSLYTAITNAKMTNERVIQTIIWNQLATEWAEILYQVRNTNFLKYDNDREKYIENCINTQYEWNTMSGYYDCLSLFRNQTNKPNNINNCRLSLNYETCFWNNQNNILNTWYYYISTENWINTIQKCEWDYNVESETDCFNDSNKCCYRYRDEYAICLNDWWVWVPCNSWHNEWWDHSHYWKFYRYIEWKWIYNMASDSTWWSQLSTNDLSWELAQEYRFCSYVTRKWWQNWAVEICWTMTNFIE